MPSKKPAVNFHTDQWIIDKIKVIAQENNRTMSKQIEYLMKREIQKYEIENGEINK